eukprot:945072-Prymnesium_polylepis.1
MRPACRPKRPWRASTATCCCPPAAAPTSRGRPRRPSRLPRRPRRSHRRLCRPHHRASPARRRPRRASLRMATASIGGAAQTRRCAATGGGRRGSMRSVAQSAAPPRAPKIGTA